MMPDPFEVLRTPAAPVDPDSNFAARLRSRIELSLRLPRGVTATDDDLAPQPGSEAAGRAVVPYLIVADAREALEWYTSSLGARPRGETILMPDGRVGHAEMELNGAAIYLADESPESDVAAPRPGEPATVSLTVQIPDMDAVVLRAVSTGATLERPAADNPYGRNAVVRDPFGHRWILTDAPTVPGDAPVRTERIRHGDIGYVSLWVPDPDRAARFFAAVLDWPLGRHREVPWAAVNHGFAGGVGHNTLFLCFAVDDLDRAMDQVRAAGGQTEEPGQQPWGPSVMCTDTQGARFALYQLRAAERGVRPASNGERHGDVSYITMEVTDSAEARSFYAAVLDWEFVPGQAEDGWGPVDVAPMVGLSGGHTGATVVPLYRVDDIDTAVERVRRAGGSATEPAEQPYGRSSECVDDQGTRFSLAQHP
jgi:uncharacterized glyoxalase superfamily protein PhnB